VSADHLMLLAYTRCNEPTREGEWSSWYDDVHLPDILEAGADVAARFELIQKPVPGMPSVGFSHVALYEFRGPDAERRLQAAFDRDEEIRRRGDLHRNHAVMNVDVLRASKGRRVEPSPEVRGLVFVSVMCLDPSREDDWNRWYDEQHLPDMMSTGAFAAASRWLRLEPTRYGPNDLTFYDITDCSVEEAIERSAQAFPKLAAEGRKHECHVAGMSVTLRPTGKYGGKGLWRHQR
jgi:hypothetical protein